MATNVEIKAKVHDVERFKERVLAISETPGELIPQEDIFFQAKRGRLKLRILAPDRGQLIFYEREDSLAPKQSKYQISETAEPGRLKIVLGKALGIRGTVRKNRWLYWVGNSRIHLDEVEGLGSFMEIEVVMTPGLSTADGQALAAGLLDKLDVSSSDLLEGAYIDLLERS